ncbi:MAG: hypothetical protein WDM76_16205 [Limisphaerales bacterium]
MFVIDEPMVGLDPQHARVVKDVFKERSLAGVTVLVSTHQLSVPEEMADRNRHYPRWKTGRCGQPRRTPQTKAANPASLKKFFYR